MTSGKKKAAPFLIGVTGGIGSGKSAVCDAFAREGFPILSADNIAKDLCGSDVLLKKKIVALLGPEAYTAEGAYNRSFVASKVFADEQLRERLNGLIHPRVEKEIKRLSAELAAAGQGLVIIEAALVYEAEMDEWLDAVLVVDADEDIRIRRIQERDRLSVEEIQKRMNSQIPAVQKIEWADYVLKNNGTPEELGDRVHFFASLFRSLHQLRTP